MKTSDKEFDDLFSSKLNDLNIEPSAALWENITAKLNNKPKKKSFVPVLRIAAGLLVALSIGLLLMRNNDELPKNQKPQQVVKLKVQQPLIRQNEIKKEAVLSSTNNLAVKTALVSNRKVKVSTLKPALSLKPENAVASNQTFAQNHTEPNLHPEIASTNAGAAKTAVVPDVSVKLSVQPDEETPVTTVTKSPVLAAADTKSAKVKRKGIRSVGDLVNLVMAKVDKREDKLIQFSDSDDGEESNITGINLGIISIKKEK